MRRMSIASLVLVPLTAAAVVVTTGAAGPRPHSGTSSSYDSSVSTTTADTPDVKAWKDKIRKQAEGVPSFKSVPYTIDLNAKPKPVAQSDGSIPMVLVAYPASNCSLNMVVYKAKTSPTYAVASSLTSCLKKIGTIRHYIELWRLDTFGFTKR
ncbi:MAG TPA: hypothetical protein VIT65_13785, partial [Microlunatus sp.]